MSRYTFNRPHLESALKSEWKDQEIFLQSLKTELTLGVEIQDGRAALEAKGLDHDLALAAIETIFLATHCEEVTLRGLNPSRDDLRALVKGGDFTISKSLFALMPGVWTPPKKGAPLLAPWVKSGEVWHPQRETHAQGERLYSRFVKNTEQNISFRVIDLKRDLQIFHQWQNKPRVAKFWEIAQSESELKAYLERVLEDPHTTPAIVEVNGQAVGYFEFYWVKEDRLGPIYDSTDFDRGFHFLIGEEDYLGFKNTDAVLKSTVHYIYLDDVRTQIISAEPRADNAAILKYVDTFKCWRQVREFDFPHKRAVLLQSRRDLFFREGYPWH